MSEVEKSGTDTEAKVTTEAGKGAPDAGAGTPAPADKAKGDENPSLAALFDEVRRGKEASKAQVQEATTLKEKVAALEAQVHGYESSKSRLMEDTVGFLEKLGITDKKDIALVGENIMYHLMPDKAPPDLRARQTQAQMRREFEMRDAKAQREREEAEQARKVAELEGFRHAMTNHVVSNKTKYAVSADWFGDNTDEWAESLMNTAVNMVSSGRTPRGLEDVVQELEGYLSERHSRVGKSSKQADKNEKADEKVADKAAASKQPPSKTEEKRERKNYSWSKWEDRKREEEDLRERLVKKLESLGG